MFEFSVLNVFMGEIDFGLRGEHIELMDETSTKIVSTGYQIVLGLIFVQFVILTNIEPIE